MTAVRAEIPAEAFTGWMPDPIVPGLPVGNQVPTLRVVAPRVTSEGLLALEFAYLHGLRPRPSQAEFIIDALGLRADGRWASNEAAHVESRQNGKTYDFEIIALYGLFVMRVPQVLYTAHRAETSDKFFKRIKDRIRSVPALAAELMPDRSGGIREGNGKQRIKLRPRDDEDDGPEMFFRTRTEAAGRGIDKVEILFVDELQNLSDAQDAALRPTMTAAANPLVLYAGSAGGRESTVMARIMRDLRAGAVDVTGYAWEASEDDDPAAPETIARVNSGYNLTFHPDNVVKDSRRYSKAWMQRERLGIGDYPREEGQDWVIVEADFDARLDEESTIVGPIVLVPECHTDLADAALGVAGRRADGDIHIEQIEVAGGVAGLAQAIKDVSERHETLGVLVDPKSPCAPIVCPMLDALDVEFRRFTFDEVKQAWSWFYNAAKREENEAGEWVPVQQTGTKWWHRGARVLRDAMSVAQVRSVGDQMLWKRATEESSAPLIAQNWAGYGVILLERDKPRDQSLPRGVAADQAGARGLVENFLTKQF